MREVELWNLFRLLRLQDAGVCRKGLSGTTARLAGSPELF